MKKWIIPLAMAAGLVAGNANADTWYNRFRDARDIPFTDYLAGSTISLDDALKNGTRNAASDGVKCDGTTDDGAALQNALTRASAQGRVLLLPPNATCVIKTAVSIPGNTYLKGDATTILVDKNATTLTISGVTGTILAAGTLVTPLKNITIDGVTFTGPGSASVSGDTAIRVTAVNGMTIVNSTFQNFGYGAYYSQCFQVYNSSNIYVNASIFQNCSGDGLAFGNATQFVRVTNSYFGYNGDWGLVLATIGGGVASATGNLAEHNKYVQIGSDRAQDIVIQGNVIKGDYGWTGNYGVRVARYANTIEYNQRISVVGNILYNTSIQIAGAAEQQGAIFATTNATTSISSNVLHFAGALSPAPFVGMVAADVTNPSATTSLQTITAYDAVAHTVTLSGNVDALVGSGDSIEFYVRAPGGGFVNIIGNTIWRTASSCIDLVSVSGAVVTGNNLYGCALDGVIENADTPGVYSGQSIVSDNNINGVGGYGVHQVNTAGVGYMLKSTYSANQINGAGSGRYSLLSADWYDRGTSSALAVSGALKGDGLGGISQASPSDLASMGTGVATAMGNVIGASGGLVTTDGAATLTNKTMSGASNSFSNIPLSAFSNIGTTTTVLHGNASGNPTFGAVSLSADVSGTLPVANGGTGNDGTIQTYSPTLSCSSGTMTPTALTGRYLVQGKLVYVSVALTAPATNPGACAGFWSITLPPGVTFAASANLLASDFDASTLLTAGGNAPSGSFAVLTSSGLFPYIANHHYVINGWLEQQ